MPSDLLKEQIAKFLDMSLDAMQETDESVLHELLDNKIKREFDNLKSIILSDPNKVYGDMQKHWQNRTQELFFLRDLQVDFLSVQLFFSEGYFAAVFVQANRFAHSSTDNIIKKVPLNQLSHQDIYIFLDQLKEYQNLFNEFLITLKPDCFEKIFDDALLQCNWNFFIAVFKSPVILDQTRIEQLKNFLKNSVSDEAKNLLRILGDGKPQTDFFKPVKRSTQDGNHCAVPTAAI